MKNWKKIYSDTNPLRIDIVRSLLEERGFEVVVLDKMDSSYLNFGEKEVYVTYESVIQAIKTIQDEVCFE